MENTNDASLSGVPKSSRKDVISDVQPCVISDKNAVVGRKVNIKLEILTESKRILFENEIRRLLGFSIEL